MYFVKEVFGIEFAVFLGWLVSPGLLNFCIASDTKGIQIHFGIKKSKWQFGHTKNIEPCPFDYFGFGPLFLIGYKF